MKEIWKDIPNTNGGCKVSNFGNVVRIKGGNVIPAKITLNGKGYGTTSVMGKVKLIHRLICESFITNDELKPCVNHINGVKKDNKASNLEWCTYSENNSHAVKTGLNVVPVRDLVIGKLVLDSATGIFYNSSNEAARAMGINSRTLASWLKGEYPNKSSLIYA